MVKKNQMIFDTTFTKYTSSEIIGEGGSGTVFKVNDESGSYFALKLLNPAKENSEKVKRFKNELHFLEKNRHINIVTVIDRGFISLNGTKVPFYVMPLYESSLRKLISEGIKPDRILHYFGQLLDGVEAAHLLNVIHRDLKPENILYDKKADNLLIGDFGTALFIQEALYTLVETKPGTRLANFQYAAPEQRARGLSVDKRADIFALGLMLNEMFTGEIPQGTGYKTIGNLITNYSYLDEIITLMIRQSPEGRPESIDKVKQQLIGRKNDFLSRQQLDNSKQTVIKTTDIDDPLINNPIHIIGIDWVNNQLTIVLNQSVNQTWKWAFINMGSHSSLVGKGPDHFSINNDKAIISASESQVKPIIDYFKGWLPTVNRIYENRVREEKNEADKKLRLQLKKEIEDLEQRQRILSSIGF